MKESDVKPYGLLMGGNGIVKMEILGAVFMVTSHIIRNFALSTDGTASAVKRA